MSYRLTAACIISTAQHARPKVRGQSEPARAQAIIAVSFVDIHSSFIKFFIYFLFNSADITRIARYFEVRKQRRICLVKLSGRAFP
jgi:hypothetical protein